MYTKETLKKIADVLKLDVSVFEANLTSDKEETLEVPVLFTEDDKNTFGENRFKEGKKAASEILVKDLKVKHGLEFDGKSIDTLLDKFAEKTITDAKIEPDKKVSTLQAEKKALQESVTSLTEEREAIKKNFNDQLFREKTVNEIQKHIPKNTIIPSEDLVDLFMNRYRVAKEDDSVIIYKGDKALKDSLENPIPLKDAITQFAESYIDKTGMGGKDDKGGTVGKFTTSSAFNESLKKKNIEPMSAEGLKLYNENLKLVGPAFDANN